MRRHSTQGTIVCLHYPSPMAINWITALKIVPWGEVLNAAPQIAQGARRLFSDTQKQQPAPSPTPRAAQADPSEALRARILALEDEQRASAVLIQSLAEQNAQVVRAVDALRVRSQRLLAAVCVLTAATAGLLAWAVSQ